MWIDDKLQLVFPVRRPEDNTNDQISSDAC